MPKVPFVDLSRQYKVLKERLHHALDEAERSSGRPHREEERRAEPDQAESEDEHHRDAAVSDQGPHEWINARPLGL